MASALLSNAFKAGRFNLARQARSLATSTQVGTRITNLKNGLTIATESIPSAQTATIGVYVNAGSRNESAKSHGAANFLEHVAFKGTNSRSQQEIEAQVESIGAQLSAQTSREQISFTAKSFKAGIPKSVEILSDVLQNASLSNDALEDARKTILHQHHHADKHLEKIVFDHLHATAFQGESLGRPVYGTRDSVQALTRDEVANFAKSNFTADRVVLVGAGNVDHEALVKLAEEHLSKLPASTGAVASQPASFTGSEIRLQDDTLPAAHFAIAVEGVSRSSPDYYTMQVMKNIIGTWDRSLGAAGNTSSRLSTIVHDNKFANSFVSFSKSYADTGLFGLYFITENKDCQDDLVHFALKEWARLTTSVTSAEVERAKQQLKVSIRLNLDGPSAIAEEIGQQLSSTGKHVSADEADKLINQITPADVQRVASQYLWDQEVAVVGVGPIECLPDYARIRGAMSWNRF